MIIEFGPRFTYYGREIRDRVDSEKLSLPGASRLLLGNTIELDSRQALHILVLERINSILEELCDEFYGTEKGKKQEDFSESVESITLLVRSNFFDVIEGLNGESSKMQSLAGLLRFDYNPEESGVKRNSLFGTNLRILIAGCFRNEKLCGLVSDVSECLQIQSGTLPFSHMIKRFRYELRQFASDSVRPLEEDDMHQEGCIVLWNCVNKYAGQNYIPFKQYFLRSLRNKKVDLLRSSSAIKRKVSRQTTSLSAESFHESQANRELAKRYMDGYYEWLNSADNDGSNSFFAPSSIGEYFPEAGKSITETQINKTVEELFESLIGELFLYVETQIPEDHFKKLKEFFSIGQIGMIFLKFLFGNPDGRINLDGMQQIFLQRHMKGCIHFDGRSYSFQNPRHLQVTFLKMCQEILEKDPIIQIAFRIGGKKYDNVVPF